MIIMNDRNEGLINEFSFNSSIEKMNLFFQEEVLIFDKIENILNNLNLAYKSSNSKKIDELNKEYIDKMGTISRIHEDEILVLKKVQDRNIAVVEKAVKAFENLEVIKTNE